MRDVGLVRWTRLGWGVVATAILAMHAARGESFPAMADAFVANSLPGENFGSNSFLVISGPPATNVERIGLIRFDVAALRAAAEGRTVRQAVLTVWAHQVTRGGSFDVVRLNDEWQENVVSWSSLPPRGSPVLVGFVMEPGALEVAPIRLDITAAVEDWITSGSGGSLALVSMEREGGAMWFHSKDSDRAERRPQLDVAF